MYDQISTACLCTVGSGLGLGLVEDIGLVYHYSSSLRRFSLKHLSFAEVMMCSPVSPTPLCNSIDKQIDTETEFATGKVPPTVHQISNTEPRNTP